MAAMCDKCKLKPATVQVTKTVNGQTTQRMLCSDCAKEEGMLVNHFMPLAQMMAGMMGESVRPQKSSVSGLTCSRCGYDFSKFKESGLLGCPQCYEDFKEYLTPMIRRIQGGLNHLGERPGHCAEVPGQEQLAQLQKQLLLAIEHEEYEKAAELRDQIRSLKGKVESHGTVD